jgi:hypothetical protein
MSNMRECICCQCAEHLGQFKNWIQCEGCGLYGTIGNHFDDSHEVCGECVKQAWESLEANKNEQ